MKTKSNFYLAIFLLFISIGYLQGQAQNRPQPTPEQIAERRRMFEEQLRLDWAQTKKYAALNEKLISAGTSNGPVFIGDSITEFWFKFDSTFWKDNGYIDRGISGQTSSQMLVRFRRDVVALHPRVVIINAGTNDIAENTGPIALEHVFGNIVSMVEIAQANGISVVLSAVLPAATFSWRKELEPADKVIKLNAMIKEYARKHKLEYIDYWEAMADKDKGLDAKYTLDGVHPTTVGYKVMDPLAKNAIDATLKKRKGK
jgi:lysophospholipase L1-like esterase